MKKILPPLILGLCLQATAQPTNNPVMDLFPTPDPIENFGWTHGDYSWTNEIEWENVETTLASGSDDPVNSANATAAEIIASGADDLSTVEAEIAALSAAGGGVLYFPAGTYYFSDYLHLMDGVVIRGEKPSESPTGQTDAREADYEPMTKFVFPRLPGIVTDPDVPGSGQLLDPSAAMTFTNATENVKAFKAVTIDQDTALTARNYGIVDIDLNRARIDFLKEERADGTIDKYSILFGTDEKNRMQGGNVVVFGNRLNNSAQVDFDIPTADPDYNDWQVWTNRSKPSIDVMAKENIMIANNRLNDKHWQVHVNGESQLTYPVDDFYMPTDGPSFPSDSEVYLNKSGNRMSNTGETGVSNPANRYIYFNYTRGGGIFANRSSRVGFAEFGPNNPAGEPTIYRQGVTIRQNFVYTSERVGIQASGNGLEVRDNVRVDKPNQVVWMKPSGDDVQGNNSATYECRGIDVSGMNILVDNNDYEVYRRSIRGGYPTVDGEGILIQPNDGGHLYNWTITNNRGNAYLGLYRVQYGRNIFIQDNVLTATGQGDATGPYILADFDPNFFPGIVRNLTIDGNTANSITVKSGLVDLSSPHTITNNTVGSITVPDYSNGIFGNFINDLMWNNNASGNSVALTLGDWASGYSGEFESANLLDQAPIVEIVHPTPETVLVAGQPITVEVEVSMDEANGQYNLDSVILYDCSQLGANQQIRNNAHRTDANSLAGSLVLTSSNATGLGSGTYTAQWTPSQEYLEHGLFVIEALVEQITVKDASNNNPPIDMNYKDSTFALLGQVAGTIIPDNVEIVGQPTIVGNIFSIVIADDGLTYEVGASTDLSTAPSTWTALTTEVTIGAPSGGQRTITIDKSTLGDAHFFVIRGQ